MEDLKENDEINLKELGKKVVKAFNNKKKVFYVILFVLLALSTLYFLKVIYSPSYKANCILVSRNIKKDQLQGNIDLYSNYIKNPDLTIIDKSISDKLTYLNITSIKIEELKNIDAIPVKENEYNYIQYKLLLTYNSKNDYSVTNNFIELIIKDIQNNQSQDNRVIELKKRYEIGITDIDSIIKIASQAGNSYTNKISSAGSGQLMVMNDIYNGINNLVTQKLNLQQELSMLQPNNLLFKSTPTIVTKAIEYPWAIFSIALLIWGLICGIWILLHLVFGEN